jgi:hypothetical protein
MKPIRSKVLLAFQALPYLFLALKRRKTRPNPLAFPANMHSPLPRLDEGLQVARRPCVRIAGDVRIEPVTFFFSRIQLSDLLSDWPGYRHQLNAG